MKYEFDGSNKIIKLINDDNTNTFNAQDLYSKWKEWVASDINNMKYPQAMRSIGGNEITPTERIAPYIEVLNDWRIKPYDGEYILYVEGNLFATGGVSPFINPDDGNVVISIQVTGKALAVNTDVSEVKQKIIEVLKLLGNKAEISPDGQLVTIYDDDGSTIIKQFSISADKRIRTPL